MRKNKRHRIPTLDRADLDTLALAVLPALDDSARARRRVEAVERALEIHPATAHRRADLVDAIAALSVAERHLRRVSRS